MRKPFSIYSICGGKYIRYGVGNPTLTVRRQARPPSTSQTQAAAEARPSDVPAAPVCLHGTEVYIVRMSFLW